MYNKDGPLRIGVEMWVINRLHYFRTKYIATKTKAQCVGAKWTFLRLHF